MSVDNPDADHVRSQDQESVEEEKVSLDTSELQNYTATFGQQPPPPSEQKHVKNGRSSNIGAASLSSSDIDDYAEHFEAQQPASRISHVEKPNLFKRLFAKFRHSSVSNKSPPDTQQQYTNPKLQSDSDSVQSSNADDSWERYQQQSESTSSSSLPQLNFKQRANQLKRRCAYGANLLKRRCAYQLRECSYRLKSGCTSWIAKCQKFQFKLCMMDCWDRTKHPEFTLSVFNCFH